MRETPEISNLIRNLRGVLVGVDEVGRGCLAGPVTAAAVVFNSDIDIHLYQDSKQLSEEKRKELSLSIHQNHTVSIGWASVEEVDQINILQATFLAMRRALNALPVKPQHILIDGRDCIPDFVVGQQYPVIQGDQKVRLISAASIAAKVARDDFMKNLATQVAGYGFETHKGYGTKMHRLKIAELGPTIWHRKSFSGVKEFSR